ncbi:MAG TPA: alpha/beta hydrolase-fold protein [Thermoanaerobaculia bacterium]|nr:alpha/beta hydrolase-fold protein [Thermoanaerobaculia bacterium]
MKTFLFALLALNVHAAPLTIGQTFTLRSKVLREERRINVYLPAAYAKDARLPVLYMPDGGLREDFLHIAGLVQVLSGNAGMRPFILVGIENTDRRRDMTAGSANFRKFISDELMPSVDKRYRTTKERAIVGESLAGLFVVETFVLQPELFDTYIAVDPSVWWNDGKLVDERIRAANKSLFIAASKDAALDLTERFVRAAREANRVQYEAMPEEGHATIFHPAALRAFRMLLR